MNLFFANIAYANVDGFIHNVNKLILNPLIVMLFAVALAVFLWGVFDFISNQESEEKKKTGKQHMLWGLVGIAIMMSVWTLLGIVLNTFDIKNIDPQKGDVKLNDYSPNYPAIKN